MLTISTDVSDMKSTMRKINFQIIIILVIYGPSKFKMLGNNKKNYLKLSLHVTCGGVSLSM